MYLLCTTRFNEQTWLENQRWRDVHNWTGCIYGTPKQISDTILPGTPMIVLEMNNDENKIKGIGFIKNNIVLKERIRIYTDGNFNRYVYRGKTRISRDNLNSEQEKILRVLDAIVFKGERHMKRAQGITIMPKWVTNNKHIDFIKILGELR